jgi:hypothetical protein
LLAGHAVLDRVTAMGCLIQIIFYWHRTASYGISFAPGARAHNQDGQVGSLSWCDFDKTWYTAVLFGKRLYYIVLSNIPYNTKRSVVHRCFVSKPLDFWIFFFTSFSAGTEHSGLCSSYNKGPWGWTVEAVCGYCNM